VVRETAALHAVDPADTAAPDDESTEAPNDNAA
jgi:hypothetical protein